MVQQYIVRTIWFHPPRLECLRQSVPVSFQSIFGEEILFHPYCIYLDLVRFIYLPTYLSTDGERTPGKLCLMVRLVAELDKNINTLFPNLVSSQSPSNGLWFLVGGRMRCFFKEQKYI